MRHGRKIFLSTVLLCLAAVAAYFFLYHQPLERKILQLELDRRKAAQQSVDIINFKNRHGDLSKLMLDLNEQRNDLERALPPQLSQGEFINYMQSTALAHQIRLLEITPNTPTRDEALPITRLPIRVHIECTYFELLDFLKALEQSERFIDIKNFKATSTSEGARLNCELELMIFAAEIEEDTDAEIFDGGRVARTAIDGDS